MIIHTWVCMTSMSPRLIHLLSVKDLCLMSISKNDNYLKYIMEIHYFHKCIWNQEKRKYASIFSTNITLGYLGHNDLIGYDQRSQGAFQGPKKSDYWYDQRSLEGYT